MKLSEAIRRFINSKTGVSSPNTIIWYRYLFGYVTEFLGDPNIEDITLEDLEAFRSHLIDKGRAISTIRHTLRGVKTLFNYLIDGEFIDKSPARRLKLPREPDQPRKGISDEALVEMLKVAKVSRRDEAMLLFLRDSGCRRGGLATLKLDDLNMPGKRALVYEKGPAGGYSRYVYFTDECQRALEVWLGIRGYFAKPDTDTLFVSVNGRQKGSNLTVFGINNIVNRLARIAGVKTPHSPHQFRHAAARRWIKAGAPLPVVQQLMGHKDSATTSDFYSKLDNNELAEQFDKYSTPNGKKLA